MSYLYPKAREGFAIGEIDYDTAVIKAALVRGYTYDDTDKFVSDVTGGGGTVHGTPVALASKDATNGILDAAAVTFTTPAANANDHYVLLYQASAVTGGADVAASAQRVLAWIDVATGLPVQPNGADIVVTFDTGTNKIVHL